MRKVLRTCCLASCYLLLQRQPSAKCQKQPSRSVLRKRCSENMQQVYRRTTMTKYGFEIRLRHECFPINLLHIFRTPFLRTPLQGCFCSFNIMSVSPLKMFPLYLLNHLRKIINGFMI